MLMAGKSLVSAPQHTTPADLASYVEGIVRGYRNSLLSGQNYSNLTQCETIDGMSPDTVVKSMADFPRQMSSSSWPPHTATTSPLFPRIPPPLPSQAG